MKATQQNFPVLFLFIMLYKVVLTFAFSEILMFDHSNGNYRAVLPSAIYVVVQGASNILVC